MFKEILLSDSTEKRGQTRRKIQGIGINDAPYKPIYKINGITYQCPYYVRWTTMFTRCYSKNWLEKHPTYIGCVVTPEWHSFMTFKTWMMQQDWKNKVLDKDLLSFGNKIYSPETCMFITPKVNGLFNSRENYQGEYPLGIYFRKNKYEVGVSDSKSTIRRTWVGAYDTIPEAIDAYLAAKLISVNYVISLEPNPKVKKAIRNYYKYFADKQICLKAGY